VEHLRACHSRPPLGTRAVIVLPEWPKLKAVTKELVLNKQLPKRVKGFMRTTLTCSYDQPCFIAYARVMIFWVIDASTLVSITPSITANVSVLKF
jgi:hypothetical protein